MKAEDIPAEVYVIFTDVEWPVDIVDSASHALTVRERRMASGNVSARGQVHVWKATLTPVEEMAVTDPVPARLVPRGGTP